MSETNIDVIDLSEKLRPYENMWVALSRNTEEIIAAEKTSALLICPPTLSHKHSLNHLR